MDYADVVHRPVITYYRESDGHTYWQDSNGDWLGAPTYLNGSVDWPNGGYILDFSIGDDTHRRLEHWLTAITANPSLDLDAPDL